MVESESHGHIPVRRKDASPVRHPQSDETPEVPGIERLSHEPTVDEVVSWVGWNATDEMGKTVGKVEDVYAVEGHPEWLLIKHRRSHHFLAPIAEAIGGGDRVFLPYTAEVIETAPEVDPGAEANELVVAAAREHYDSAKGPAD
ncbi:MAG: hypothetical protein M9964_04620 [Solirubrobacterales bacterium]|nr:hypothetical protein [Solirubrobacterales bacterium]